MVQNYWTMKSAELVDFAKSRGIEEIPTNENGTLNRKELISILTQMDAHQGRLSEPVYRDEETGETTVVSEVAEEDHDKKFYPNGWVDVVFHNQEGQPKYIFLGLNGKTLYLPREVPVRIPREFMGVVRNAVMTKIVQRERPDRRGVDYTEIRVPRFSYEVLKQSDY